VTGGHDYTLRGLDNQTASSLGGVQQTEPSTTENTPGTAVPQMSEWTQLASVEVGSTTRADQEVDTIDFVNDTVTTQNSGGIVSAGTNIDASGRPAVRYLAVADIVSDNNQTSIWEVEVDGEVVPSPGALPAGLALLGGFAMIRRRRRA